MNDQPVNNGPNERSLLQKILSKAEDLATLEILTTVAPIRKTNGQYEADLSGNPPSILTKIELIEGDIVTAFHKDSLTADLQELRKLHKEREEQGMTIVNERIAAVKELIQLVSDMRSARKKEAEE